MDDKYIDSVLDKHDENIYNNFIKFYEALTKKTKSIVEYFHNYLNDQNIILSQDLNKK